jgi:hypothetical protein
VTIFAAPNLHAFWIPDGSPICTAVNNQELPAIVTDGAGGAIVAWTDVRNNDFDIYAQQVNERGAPVWQTDGVPVCTITGVQSYPQMVSDGAGGAIIAWHDIRDGSGDWDIYAQRIDAGGALMWPDTGVVLCDTILRSESPAITTDGAGGAIVVWQDRRGMANALYAQRVDPAGNTLWDRNGVRITRDEDWEVDHQIISDGDGGAIVVWEDSRDYQDLYAQRINADGDTLWELGGVAVCTAPLEQRNPVLTTDGAGGAIIAWYDQRTPGRVDVYAQRIDADGNALWMADGDTICSTPNNQLYPVIVSDDAGGAIVVWNETGGAVSDVHAQRIDPNGNPMWTDEGVVVCSAPESQNAIRAVPDGSGGVIAAWEDARDSDQQDIYAQRVSAPGAVLWLTDGVAVCTAFGFQEYVALTTTGNGETIFVWEDARDSEWDIYGSLADANGNLVPTLLEGYEAGCRDGVVVVRWSMSTPIPVNELEFDVYRTSQPEGEPWHKIALEVEGSGDGRFELTDRGVLPGTSYRYRVDVTGDAGRQTLLETEAIAVPAPSITLYQNTPNPFNHSTSFRFYLPRETVVTLSIYDNAGRLVDRPVDDESKEAGIHTVEWDGIDGRGKPVASGVYFYSLNAGKWTASKKMVLLR